jgi:methyltransferase (TIGR00027 family)
MEKGQPSSTAEGAAVMRALHQTLDEEPKILDDPIAMRLIDPESEVYKMVVAILASDPTQARFRGIWVMRSRYAEDCLAESVANGVRQYVLLGAGLDTFAYRQPPWAWSLRIFEVDYPATQQWKRGKLTAANIAFPDNLKLAPVDFETTSLKQGLAAAGFDFNVPTFFSSLGVTQYLTEEAFDLTLKFVLSLPPASEIVFSFVLADSALSAEDAAAAALHASNAVHKDEPWLSRFVPEQLASKLAAQGFSKVVYFSTDDANDRYFRGRRDGLEAWRVEQMMRAVV